MTISEQPILFSDDFSFFVPRTEIVAFKMIDTNKNGVLDRGEVKMAILALHKSVGNFESLQETEFKRLGQKELEEKVDSFVVELFQDFDENKDENLSLEEFTHSVMSSPLMKEMEEKLTFVKKKPSEDK